MDNCVGSQYIEFAPEAFDLPSIEESKRMILGWDACGLTPDQRWERETPWLMKHIKFGSGLVIDYGCGVGRLAREISNPVLGVDLSPMMRQHAIAYVDRPNDFSVTSPDIFRWFVASGLRVNGIVSVWVLMHVLDLETTIALLMQALHPDGIFWLLDGDRAVLHRSKGYPKYLALRDGACPLTLLKQFCTVEDEIPVDCWPEYPDFDAGVLRKLKRK